MQKMAKMQIVPSLVLSCLKPLLNLRNDTGFARMQIIRIVTAIDDHYEMVPDSGYNGFIRFMAMNMRLACIL